MLHVSLFSEPDLGFSYILVKLKPETQAAILQEKLYFSESDQLEFEAVSHPAKQLEWLASRYAIHTLLENNELIYKGLRKDSAGKPFLEGNNFHFSLSHTQGYAAAVIHPKKPIGIDIELVSTKLSRVAYKFLSISELKEAGDSLEKLCVYWAAKEALYKLHGKKGEISFLENLSIEPFEIGKDFFWIKGKITLTNWEQNFKILIRKMGELYLAIAF